MKQKRIGLSLSGGGYRAAAFHLGTLAKLNELNILKKVSVISTVSGGSIIGAYYALNSDKFSDFEERFYSFLLSKNIQKTILLSKRSILTNTCILLYFGGIFLLAFYGHGFYAVLLFVALIVVGWKYQFSIFPISQELENAYDKIFYNYATLSQLPDTPVLAINSTNLQTCRPFTFSKNKMEDSAYSYPFDGSEPIKFVHSDFPIARAVAASSCVPYAFNPIKMDTQFFVTPSDSHRCQPELIDGGIYDNQGIHKITQRNSSFECDIIMVSDAGNLLPFSKKYFNLFVLLIRAMDLFMQRIKAFQMIQHLYQNRLNGSNKEISYFSLGWDLKNCIPGFINNLKNGNIIDEVIAAHKIPDYIISDIEGHREELSRLLETRVDYPEIIARDLTQNELELARKVKTKLKPISKNKLDCLIKHAQNLTELQTRLYCPSLF